ncbi:hypothetical protein RJ639_020110, partial [Escallonia herrerae]
MEAPKTIEHQIGGMKNDALRFGLHGVKSDIVGSHPLESATHHASSLSTIPFCVPYASVRQEEMKRKMLANTYGSAFPLKMELDRKILSRRTRGNETGTNRFCKLNSLRKLREKDRNFPLFAQLTLRSMVGLGEEINQSIVGIEVDRDGGKEWRSWERIPIFYVPLVLTKRKERVGVSLASGIASPQWETRMTRFQRPRGAISSSMLGLEAMTGALEDFGFEDYLNDPRESETLRPADMHHGMEVRLGLSKGP